MDSSNQIKSYFQQYYPKLGTIRSIKNIVHDNINSKNFLIKTSNGSYVLRKFQDGSNYNKIEKICKILKYCYDSDVKVSFPVKNVKHQYVDNIHNYYLTQFVQGKTYVNNLYQFKDLAKQLAYLHVILNQKKFVYNYRIGHNFYKNFKPNEFKKLQKILQMENKKDIFDKLISKNFSLYQSSTFDDQIIQLEINKKKFNKQLIHFDLHSENILFNRNKVSTIIDFNAMRKGLVIEDISFCSFRLALLYTSNIKKIQQQLIEFLKIYSKFNHIGDQRNYLFTALRHLILGRLNYIIRKRYFFNSNIWIKDLERSMKSLKIINEILLLQK